MISIPIMQTKKCTTILQQFRENTHKVQLMSNDLFSNSIFYKLSTQISKLPTNETQDKSNCESKYINCSGRKGLSYFYRSKIYQLQMYVNPASNNSHLLIWVSGEAMVLGYMLGIYTFKAVLDSGAYSLVLKSIDDQYFQSSTNQDNVETSLKLVEGYLLRECGKRFKVSYRNRVLAEASIEELLKILLYCCLHSKTKQQYVERIFTLDENIQSTLMSAIQEINANLLNVVNYQQVLLRVEELENQVQTLKAELAASSGKEQTSRKLIEQLQQELKKRNTEVKLYKAEKQKVIEALQLPNFEDYLSSFQRVQQQNRILNRYVQELEDSNNDFDKNQKHLRRQLQNQSIVIVDLSQNISSLKDKIKEMKLQASINCNRNSYDDTYDDSRRSFGVQLNLNKENGTSKKKNHRGRQSFENWDQLSFGSQKNIEKEQCLVEEMKELRKYNSDLIHKLDTVYKTLNNLTYQTSQIKQKNEGLAKENKFYRKQIKCLRKLQQRMQIDMLNGVI